MDASCAEGGRSFAQPGLLWLRNKKQILYWAQIHYSKHQFLYICLQRVNWRITAGLKKTKVGWRRGAFLYLCTFPSPRSWDDKILLFSQAQSIKKSKFTQKYLILKRDVKKEFNYFHTNRTYVMVKASVSMSKCVMSTANKLSILYFRSL